MSKPYSGIPVDERHTWVVPRWLKEAFVAFAIVSLLAVGISKTAQHYGGKLDRAKSSVEADEVAMPPPPTKLPLRGGGELDLSQLKGKVVLVNFWATWCPPCRDEMPSLEKLAGRYDPQSFELVAVSVDDSWGPVEKFLAPTTPLKVLLDVGARISLAYGTSKFPESYLVDKEGTVRLKFVGPRNWTDPGVATLLESFGARPKAG